MSRASVRSISFRASGLHPQFPVRVNQSLPARLHGSDQPPAHRALNNRCRRFQPRTMPRKSAVTIQAASAASSSRRSNHPRAAIAREHIMLCARRRDPAAGIPCHHPRFHWPKPMSPATARAQSTTAHFRSCFLDSEHLPPIGPIENLRSCWRLSADPTGRHQPSSFATAESPSNTRSQAASCPLDRPTR